MSPRARIAVVVVAVAALVVAFVVAGSSGKDDAPGSSVTQTAAPAPAGTTSGEPAAVDTATTTTPATRTSAAPAIPVIVVVDGKARGGVKRLQFDKGDTIRFAVRSDTAAEIHVHGYDVARDVEAGGRVTFSIPAKIDGRFAVELEASGTQIAELEVQP